MCCRLQVAVAGGRVTDSLAVDQHQALGRLGAAYVNPRQTAAPAGLPDLHPRYPTQQIRDAARLQAVDVFAGEHGVGGAAVVAGFHLAVGADQHVRQFQGLIAFEGVGQEWAGRQKGQRQGEAGEIHGLFVESEENSVPCRSWLASEASGVFEDAFASKPAPTVSDWVYKLSNCRR
jgi:hypothetical protein